MTFSVHMEPFSMSYTRYRSGICHVSTWYLVLWCTARPRSARPSYKHISRPGHHSDFFNLGPIASPALSHMIMHCAFRDVKGLETAPFARYAHVAYCFSQAKCSCQRFRHTSSDSTEQNDRSENSEKITLAANSQFRHHDR